MTEDVSASIKLGVMMLLMSMLIVAVVNIAVTGNRLMNSFTERYVMSMHTADSSVLSSLSKVPDIGAATAYKIIEERIGSVNSIFIRYLDGIVTQDHKTLLENAGKIVSIHVERTGNGVFDIEIEEVGR